MDEVRNVEKQTRQQILEYARKKQWGKILIPTGIPVLDEAVRLQKIYLVEPIIAGDYDLAFRRAVFYKHKAIILSLHPHVKNIHAPSVKQNGQCALHFAAMNGMDDIVTVLIQWGAYPNILDKEKNTPLHLACKNNHISTAITLIECGAVVTLNSENQTPGTFITNTNAYNEFATIANPRMQRKFTLRLLVDDGLNWINDNAQLTLVVMNIEEKFENKLKEIYVSAKIKCFSAEQIIKIEKEHRDSLTSLITKMLQQEPGKRCYAVNLPFADKCNEYNELTQKVLRLEKNLGCEFSVRFNNKPVDSPIGYYFLKSKSPVSSEICEKLDKAFYRLSVDSELLIYGHDLDRCIVDSKRKNQSDLPTVASSQTNGFGMFDHSQAERVSVLPKHKEFKLSITDANGNPYNDLESDSENATPAQYFAAWTHIAVDLLNGGHSCRELFHDLDPERAPKMAAAIFVSELHKHPYFSIEKMTDQANPNHQCFLEIRRIMHLNIDQAYEESFAKCLTMFKVPGITVKIECVEADLTKSSQPRFKFATGS